MKNGFFSLVAISAVSMFFGCLGWMFPVMAADLKVPAKAPAVAAAPFDPFSGGYIGAHVGYGFDLGTSVNAFAPATLAALAASPQGAVGGLQIGYGQRLDSVFYLGIEADASAADITGTASMPGFITATSKDSFLASMRGRFGLIIGNVLAYGTAGWGWGGGSFTVQEAFSGAAANVSPTLNGFTWGGGIEFPIIGNWLGRLEYLQYDFGSATLPSPTVPTLTYSTLDRVDVIRLGVDYKF